MEGGERRHFVVIGAMKCATTSVHAALASHPSVAVPRRKELDFFSDPRTSALDPGIGAAYQRLFRGCDAPVVGEASPSYTMHPLVPGVPARMAAAVPDARLIYCLRDPVERMRSHYRHEVLRSRERRPAHEALRDRRYLVPSLYGSQLAAYLDHFPAEQIAVVASPEVLDGAAGALDELFAFLGLEPRSEVRAEVAFGSEARPPLGRTAERLRSVPGARAALALVPSGAKARLAARLPGARRAAAASRDLFATAPGWWPDEDQVVELRRDDALLATLLARCRTIGRLGWRDASPPP